MALDYLQSSTLMLDPTFRGRVKVACLKFADYISDEPITTPAHSARLRWAGNVWQSPDMAAANVTPQTVMEPQVQTDGDKVTDVDLQVAVETVVNKIL